MTNEQFLTLWISIAVAFTGLTTLHLSLRRFRSQRAVLAVQELRAVGGNSLEVENVGDRPALDIIVRPGRDEPIAKGGLRPGDRVVVRIASASTMSSIELEFRDADNWRHHVRRGLVRIDDEISLEARARIGPGRWVLETAGLLSPD